MEIYSPISKNKDLFKKNRFKDDPPNEMKIDCDREQSTYLKRLKPDRTREASF
jgi:hypothetical protein